MGRTHLAPELFATIDWRCIGPHRGGRVVAVAGDPVQPQTFYFGACAGGVWKTGDGGTYWENVSDGYFGTAAVGALAVAEADPNVIYAGTGEACIRVDVSHGDGVYRSTDGGATWSNVGLTDSRHVGRIRIHPDDPDLVYVAALGHAFGRNEQRGVFRSRDGGANWERVLFRNAATGAIDLCIDPTNPRVLYAALWQVIRRPWVLESGGPGSGIFKSTDGGDTWTELSDNPGLPEGIKGRIGIACSPARAGRVWAIVEAEKGALFRSEDGGANWEVASAERELRQRPWYYHHVFADPQDADTVWVLNLQAWKSTDAGNTFAAVSTPHGDNHDLWIDPADPRRMIEGNDGGACVSFNGGDTWSTIYNQPTAQFYHLCHRHTVPVPGVRHAAGQLRDQRAEPLGPGHHPPGRLLPVRLLGERPHPGAPRQPRHRLLRRRRQRPPAAAACCCATIMRPRRRASSRRGRRNSAATDPRTSSTGSSGPTRS